MHMTAIVSRGTCLQSISFDWFGLTWIELVVASWQTCMHGTIWIGHRINTRLLQAVPGMMCACSISEVSSAEMHWCLLAM
jgi:hypothetical protein